MSKRASVRRNVVAKRVEDALGNRTICRECGARLHSYSDRCRAVGADLGRQCEGFRTIEAVLKPISKEVYKL